MARRRERGFIMRQSLAGLFRVCNRLKGDLPASNRRRPVVIAPKQALATSNAFDRRIFMRFAIALMLMPILPLAVLPAPAMAETAPATAQDEALLRFLDDAFDARIALQPESQTHLGLKTDYDRLDDYTDAAAVREQALLDRKNTRRNSSP